MSQEKLEKLYQAESLGYALLGSFFKDTLACVQIQRQIKELEEVQSSASSPSSTESET